MKKHDFKKLAALGLAVGLTVASSASACCGKERDKSDSSGELLSSLNKTEGFMLAGGKCGGGKCGSASNASGTRNSNISMGETYQGTTRTSGGTYQGTPESTQIQGGFESDPSSSNYRYNNNQGGYTTQTQQQNWNQPQQQNQWQQNQTPEQRYRNYQQNAPRSSGSCGGVTTSSGFNT